ncbi:hypothetical protein M758_11G038800 [Ceratodon purpureus]|nr:hypothetical protein M758_11G038800 [Ceratodon purpureus]
MEAVVDDAALDQEHIAKWLMDTTGPQESAVQAATVRLEAAQTVPKFGLFLLMLSAGGQEKGQRIAAATYLKNFVKKNWSDETIMSPDERLEFRNQLVEVLLRVDGLVLKILAEAFRFVADNDFAKKMTWPELVPAFKTAIQNSDLVNVSGASELKTLNVLMGLQTIIKPYKYFMDPTVAREPVPEQLELISKELLAPLQGIFHHLVQQVAASKSEGYAQHDNILLVLCKCLYLAIKSHMPQSLLACLGPWFQDLMILLEAVELEKKMDLPEQEPRLKTWKRVLQLCCNLVSRHRKHVDKYLAPMGSAALTIVWRSTTAKDLHPMQERIVSLAFDVVSNILETGPGWRLMAPHFRSLVENAIFPALTLKNKDVVEWEEDEDEYVRKNLPSELENSSGWKEDLFTPRQSALNLLGLIATSKGPPTAEVTKNVATMKRKKGGKGKNDDGEGTAGEVLVIPFLSQFPLPPDGIQPDSEITINYFGALMAYGGLHEFLKTQDAETITMLLQSRVFPLYTMVLPSPYVLATSNWLLGKLATCLPEDLNGAVYTALLKALLAPDAGGVSWRLVRASAAGALTSLLQDDYKPGLWLPLLQAAVAGARNKDESEAAISLQLLATVAEVGEDDVAPHVPDITAAVQEEICQHIPPHPEPWPMVVELGFAALAALAQTWDSTEPEEDEEDHRKQLQIWKAGCTQLSNTFSALLQRAWLSSTQDDASPQSVPPPSCLSDASVLLVAILRYTDDQSIVALLKVEPLLHVWSHLIMDWKAWEDEEDESVFDAIEEAVALQGRCPMADFTEPPESVSSFPGAPHSVIENLVVFVTTAIESAYPAACWRACRCAHAILHTSSVSFEGEAIALVLVPKFCKVSAWRLHRLTNMTVPLAKPLILVISMCFILLPEIVNKILSAQDEAGALTEDRNQGFLRWANALAGLAESEAEPGLSLESEMKLAAMALQKVLEYMLRNDQVYGLNGQKTIHHCFRSLLEVMVDLKELLESSDSDESDEESESEEDDEEDESDEELESEESETEHAETEDQFLERYAQTARQLQEEAVEEAENGQDEDGHEIELGVLGLVDQEAAVLACLSVHGKRLLSEQSLPKELLTRFKEKFPACKAVLS